MKYWTDFKPLILILTILFGLIYTALRLDELFRVIRGYWNEKN